MDFWDITRLMARRWYFSLPLLALSILAAVLTGKAVKPDYSSIGHLQLIPPSVTPDEADKAGRGRNPWADLGVGAMGEAAMIKVRGQSVIDDLVSAHLTDNFTVSMDGRSPIITVESIARTPEQATATTRRILTLLDEDVAAEQRVYSVPRNESITTLTLDDGSSVTAVTSKTKRTLVVVGGAVLLIAVAITVALDALLRRRTRQPLSALDTWPRTIPPEPVRPAFAHTGNVQMVKPFSGPLAVTAPEPAHLMRSNGHYRTVPHADTPVVSVEFQPIEVTDKGLGRAEHPDVDTAAPEMPVTADATIVLPLTDLRWAGREDESN